MDLPAEEVPPEAPEPALVSQLAVRSEGLADGTSHLLAANVHLCASCLLQGINFARDGMEVRNGALGYARVAGSNPIGAVSVRAESGLGQPCCGTFRQLAASACFL